MVQPHAPSLWEATAGPAPVLPCLDGDMRTEVAIIGGGYTGLAAARELARSATACLVIEQDEIGWGASGRNAGSLVPRYKKSYVALAQKLGNDVAMQLHRTVLQSLRLVEQIVEEYAIECDFRRCGQLTVAHRHGALKLFEAEAGWLRRNVGYDGYSVIDAAGVREELATDGYFGGALESLGAAIQPLSYARGFAAGLARNGIPIFVKTRAKRIREQRDGLVIETDRGAVHAKHVIVATNAYSARNVVPGSLERRIVPVASSVLVTEPALSAGRPLVNPGRRQFIDTKRLVHYGYLLKDGRLLFGGRGDITGRSDRTPAYEGLEKALISLFPQMAGVKVEYRWSGMVAMTLDDFPHLGRIGERVFYALGYGGRGVLLSHVLGTAAAKWVRREPPDLYPLHGGNFPIIPFHALRIPMMKLAAGWYGLRDSLERRWNVPPRDRGNNAGFEANAYNRRGNDRD